ncbi:hypothetical protein [Actinomadura parmotrematis]|uniref:Uncharacterized protein n=1 Tax=Actinomadura parmotrematis TaxID=2864039 RepID=A0ABS7FPJ3_9ACTN|nr:hypothetical protein [Actinomadura parmotrematis]MBW8482324.1 hypothetical protein [Actinomadura parmotrematis]
MHLRGVLPVQEGGGAVRLVVARTTAALLRGLAAPNPETEPAPILRGFLRRGADDLRLYPDAGADHAVIAADVRVSGAVTAPGAALPALIEERGRLRPDDGDPHCVAVAVADLRDR